MFVIAIKNQQAVMYVATWENGDPPRTYNLESAKRFASQEKAQKHAEKLQSVRPFDFEVEPLEQQPKSGGQIKTPDWWADLYATNNGNCYSDSDF